MSDHASPASPDVAVEFRVASDGEQTLLHDAKPDVEPHSETDGRQMSQQRQLIQLPNGREPRRWISKTDWTDYIKEDPLVRLRSSSVVSIFRVPNLLKDAKKEAYVPRRVSLGPYHHRSAELPQMGHHKGRAMRRMMKRFNTNMDFADRAMEKILNLGDKIKDSYEENIDCDGATLARMLILDGCFILEVLTTLFGKNNRTLEGSPEAEECECHDPIFGKNNRKLEGSPEAKECEYHDPIFGKNKLRFAASDILYDILMLENQVPMIVLKELFQLVLNSNVDIKKELDIEKELLGLLMHCARGWFKPVDDGSFNVEQWSCPKPGEQQVHHLLGFLHTAIVSPTFNEGKRVDQGDTAIVSPLFNRGECVDQGECCIFVKRCSMSTGMLQDENKAQDDIKSIPRAVELTNAGIKFKPCNGGIKEIKFHRATISLPPISIQDSTEIVFRNLIAFEMCKPCKINHVTCYVRLMDELIDSQEDVALLKRMGVLTNWLGSDKEVADLFNCLCKDVIISEDAFTALRKEVNAHYNNKLKVRVAELVREHFSSPWKALALAAAIVILLLTVVQTIFSIISVYKGK